MEQNLPSETYRVDKRRRGVNRLVGIEDRTDAWKEKPFQSSIIRALEFQLDLTNKKY